MGPAPPSLGCIRNDLPKRTPSWCTLGFSAHPAHPPPPLRHSVWLLLLYGALDSHPFFPSHVASGRCVLSATAAGALAGVVSAFAEPSSCVGAVLNVTWCAVCAPNNWRIEDVLVVAGIV